MEKIFVQLCFKKTANETLFHLVEIIGG